MQATADLILRENTPYRREAAPGNSEKPKLLDQFREALRSRHYRRRTEQTFAHWVKRFIHYLNIRALKPTRLPVIMTRVEVKSVLANLSGNKWLMASVIYGAGLRLMECQRLQFQDVDFSLNEILVRDGKGEKDRVTKRTCPMGGGTCKPKRLSTGSIPSSEGLALAVGFPPGKPLDQSQDELYG